MAKAKVIHNEDACVILVEGDKNKRPEPSENIIKFPGGGISVVRTSNNEYWAHIDVHKGQILDDLHQESKNGTIIDSRVDYTYSATEYEITPINNPDFLANIDHIAVRIRVI